MFLFKTRPGNIPDIPFHRETAGKRLSSIPVFLIYLLIFTHAIFPVCGGRSFPDAIVYDKLNLLKKDFFGYIERNTDKVDANLPVFYGHVISALDKLLS